MRNTLPVLLLLLTAMTLAACGGSSGPGPTPVASQVPTAVSPPSAPLQASLLDDVVTVSSAPRYIWPAEGTVVLYFERGRSAGIEIQFDTEAASTVKASTDGVISAVSSDESGAVVEIADMKGKTVYRHLGGVSVKEGATVRQGDTIGAAASTGESPEKRLRFELYEGTTAVDPLRYLSQDQANSTSDRVACRSESISLDPVSQVGLRFLANSSGYAIEDVKLTPLGGGVTAAGVTATATGPLRVSVAVPVAPAANGQRLEWSLDVTVAKDGQRQTLDCHLVLQAWTTGVNPPPTPTPAPPGALSVSPTATPTRTPGLGVPATITPRPTKTPVSVPTAQKPVVQTPAVGGTKTP